MNPARPFISLTNVTIRAADRLVFRNTTWTFMSDQHWAVIGPNGCGKTLFASVLCGAVPVVQGEIRYHFRPPRGLSPEQAVEHVSFERQKAFVADSFVQSRWTSIEEEGALRVSEFLSRRRVEEVNPFEIVRRDPSRDAAFARRQRRAIAAMQIEGLLDRTLMTLSNGETRKVMLARALCRPLRLLILDDPFAGLDARSRRHFRAIVERLMRGGLRLLLIAPHLDELPSGVTHTMRLDRCRVVEQGAWRAVFRDREVERRHGHRGPVPRSTGFLTSYAPQARTPGDVELVLLRNVTVRYGQRDILKSVTWRVREGESWAVMGPNGSGKTTLLSLILGDNPQAYTNDISLFGRRRGSGETIWDIKKRIGWVSPELHLHYDESVTCLHAVASAFCQSKGLSRPPTPRNLAAGRRWLHSFHLEARAGDPLYALSAGLQRMVLLARAMVTAPALLVLDEPCQGLDAEHRNLFLAAVDAVIRKTTTTVIFVTHHTDEIPSAIGRVLCLRNGRIASKDERKGCGVFPAH